MKILLTIFFLTTINLFAQTSIPGPTTEEEYNYMTKGYKVQTESGLDMKKGYTFTESEEVKIGNYSFELKGLIREARNEMAGILVITKSAVSGNTYYVAIPTGNRDMMDRYYASIKAWDAALLAAYAYVTSGYLGAIMSGSHEL